MPCTTSGFSSITWSRAGAQDRCHGHQPGRLYVFLLAAVEDRLHFSIPNVPVVSLPDLVLEWFPMNIAIKSLLKLSGTSVREARHMLAVHSPLTYQPLIPASGSW